jgi:hypothetical protein
MGYGSVRAEAIAPLIHGAQAPFQIQQIPRLGTPLRSQHKQHGFAINETSKKPDIPLKKSVI